MIERAPVIVNIVEALFWDAPGGAGRLAHDLCCRQVEWGYRVFQVGKKIRAELRGRETRDGITLVRLESRFHPPPDPRNMLERMSTTRKTVRAIRQEVGEIDIIHTHTPLHGSAALKEVERTRALKVHSIHSPWLMEMEAQKHWEQNGAGIAGAVKLGLARMAARRIEGSCLGRADIITSDSAYTRHQISRDYGKIIGPKNFQVVPGWVDVERFRPDGPRTDWEKELGRTPRGPVFFTVRALVQRNGLDLLVNAASILKKQGMNFDVIIGGSGPLRSELEAGIAREGVGDRVTMIGCIEDDRLPMFYRSCDAFVLPTVALECFGIIILEALASGKPVIATPVGAIPEVLGPIFPRGLLAEASAPALAEALSRFIQGTGAALRPGEPEQLRSYVSDSYSITIGTDRFRTLYESGRAGCK